MRKLGVLAAGAAMTAGAQLLAPGMVRAEIEYPYCLAQHGGYGAGLVSCGFATMAQCRETALGIGGSCQANPYHAARPTPVTEARPRRSGRRQSGS
jgi:hypothetical protein